MADVDAFERDFGDYQRTVQSATPDQGEDAFQRDFGGYKRGASSNNDNSDTTTSTTEATTDTSNAKQNLKKQADAEKAGWARGARNVGESFGNADLWLANKLGLLDEGDTKIVHAMQKQRHKDFDTQYADQPMAQSGVTEGEIATSLPFLGAGGNIAEAGLGALSKAAPSVAPVVNVLTGNAGQGSGIVNKLTNLASRGVVGAGQAAGAGELVSSTSDQPMQNRLAQNAELGFGLGAGTPLVTGAAKYLGRVGGAIRDIVTESGQNRLANDIVAQHAGEIPNINASQLVPGSMPTLAEATGNAGIAGLQRTMRDQPGAAINPFVEREQANAAARGNLLQRAAGTPQDIEAAASERKEQADSALNSIFSGAKPTNSQPVVDTIDNILQGPGGKRDAVVTSLNNIRSKLVDKSGSLESDPATLYQSVRKQIGDLLDKKDLTNASGKQAASELLQVQQALDDSIEKGAPGFKQYLNDYSSASRPIESMQWLQNLNLTDAQGNITLSKVQNALKNVNKLQGAPGTNAAKSLTDDQVSSLRSIRDDLLRQTNTALGKSLGSNSIQNIGSQNFLAKALPGKAGVLAGNVNPQYAGAAIGSGLGALIGHPVEGGLAGGYAGNILSKLVKSKDEAIKQKIQDILLHPESFSPMVNQNGVVPRLVGSPAGKFLGQNYIPVTVGINRLLSNSSASQ